MIDITVRKLDSTSYSFSVDDDTTVTQFKEKIADSVDIASDRQRIIFSGRVLEDSSKLSDHGVHGKVVHLVSRPPPPINEPNQRAPSPPHQHTTRRGMEFVGAAMRFPGNFENAFMPQAHSQSLAASRINVAKRMLLRAEHILRTLENPTERPAEQPASEETQEEVTPVFEAQIVVPNIAAAVSEVSSSNMTLAESTTPVVSSEQVNNETVSSSESVASDSTSTPEQSTNEARPTNNSNPPNPASTENTTRTADYAALLDNLNRVQARFAPFLAEYTTFMHNDPAIPLEETRATQTRINRISETLHYLGHAYHALSDIIIRVRNPPPRFLMCRPIYIQHSAILQAGIPIQVEAQINIATTSNQTTTTSNATSTSNTTSSPNAVLSSSPTSTVNSTSNAMPNAPLISSSNIMSGAASASNISNSPSVSSHTIYGIPGGTSVRVHQIPLMQNRINFSGGGGVERLLIDPIGEADATLAGLSPYPAVSTSTRTFIRGSPDHARRMMEIVEQSGEVLRSGTEEALRNILTQPIDLTTLGRSASSSGNDDEANNPDLLFEIAPENLTVLQGSLNTPTDFIQNIVQMALGSGNPNNPPAASSTSETSTATTASDTNPVQNSQARGNTQTQPTTATYTRSTARPHVQISQHALHAFDPFLPCNSHHVGRRRHNATNNSGANNTTQPRASTDTDSAPTEESRTDDSLNLDPGQLLFNIAQSIIGSVRMNQSGTRTENIPPAPTPLPTMPNPALVTSSPITPTPRVNLPMQVDEPVVDAVASGSTSSQSSSQSNNDVTMQSSWEEHVPTEWVPLLKRDSTRQRRQSSPSRFSDAYINTLPSKRRKIIESNKPLQGNSLPQMISENVRRAVTGHAAEISNSSVVENVVQSISGDGGLQTAYREHIRAVLRDRLRRSNDFTPNRYPNANNYFMDQSQ